MKILKWFSNERGVSLLQVLVGAGVASVVSLGVVQMLENTRMTQRRINLISTLTELKTRMETIIRDQMAFNITILNNVGATNQEPFYSLSQGRAVSESTATLASPVKLMLYDSSGFPQYALYGPAASGTGYGFTEKGTKCDTFNPNAGSGTDDCPISYRILMAIDCPKTFPVDETSCIDPQMIIVARLMYNPTSGTGRVLQRFEGLIGQISGTTIPAVSSSSTSGKYDIYMKRTATSIGRSFEISAYTTSASATYVVPSVTSMTGGPFTGGGACTTAYSWHPAVSDFGWTKEYDPHSLVSGGATTKDFRFNEIGQYTCSIKAKAFDLDSVSFGLVDSSASGTRLVLASTVSPGLTESTARADFTFNVGSSATNYSIVQKCSRPSAANSFGIVTPTMARLGFKPDGTGYFAPISISCSKMDNAF